MQTRSVEEVEVKFHKCGLSLSLLGFVGVAFEDRILLARKVATAPSERAGPGWLISVQGERSLRQAESFWCVIGRKNELFGTGCVVLQPGDIDITRH